MSLHRGDLQAASGGRRNELEDAPAWAKADPLIVGMMREGSTLDEAFERSERMAIQVATPRPPLARPSGSMSTGNG